MNYKPTKSSNICKEGKNYRVRMMINGVKISRNFSSYKQAYEFKQDLLQANNL